MNFIEWRDGDFRPSPEPPPVAPPRLDAVTWWHGASDLGGALPQGVKGVTHLGDRSAAQHRADAQALMQGMKATDLFEIEFPRGLSILPEAYLENHGQIAMKHFEQKLLDSQCDVAFTWNTKEADGAWSVIVRRSVLGEIPSSFGHGFRLVSSLEWEPGPYYLSLEPLTRRG